MYYVTQTTKIEKKISFVQNLLNLNYMNEQMLHFVWQFRLFKNTYLKTVAGQTIEILDPGIHNLNAGPDFFNAKIRLDNTLWVGNVELHIDGRDWHRHKHHVDAAYNNVILHIVMHSPEKTVTVSGIDVPIMIMCIAPEVLEMQNQLQQGGEMAPCYKSLKIMNKFELNAWLDRMALEKLENRCHEMSRQLEQLNGNWEELFFRVLARSFGFGINADAFQLWSKSLPINLLKKHRNSLFQIEALCFGQAGFLDEMMTDDAYKNALTKEYRFLKDKYQLIPIEKHLWRFLRLRPANFPTIRLAQVCQLVFRVDNLFASFIRAHSLGQIRELFLFELSDYWQNHYTFGNVSTQKTKKVGTTAQNLIILNAIVPVMFYYGTKHSDELLQQKALDLLSDMKPEKNSVISGWEKAGVKCHNAMQSQALIHLKKNYCELKKCLRCRIGHLVIAKHKHEAN